jgi:hypothetical protein
MRMTHRDEGLDVVEYYIGILEERKTKNWKQVVVITCRMK